MSDVATYQDAPSPLTDQERKNLKRMFSDFFEVPGEWKTSLKADLERDPPILGKQTLGGQSPPLGPNSVTTSHIADGTITDVDVNALNKDGTAATPSLRTLGTGAQQAAAGNDSRFVPAPRTAEAFLTTAQPISLATYADLTGCSVTLAAGTWLIFGEMAASADNLVFLASLAITNAANAILRETAGGAPASGTASVLQWASLACSVIVTPASSTTYKLRAARGLTTLTGTYTAQDGSAQNMANNASSATDKATSIRAIRIA